MLYPVPRVCTRRPLISPHSTLLLLALTLFVATSLPAVTAFPVVRDEIGDNNEVTRRLSGGGGKDKNKTVPFNSWSNAVDTVQYVLAFIVVLVAAHPLGLYFPRLFRLPLITGYLFTGIIAGPFIANLITQEMVSLLASYVSALALSFISFQAGQEIYWPELQPQAKSIVSLLTISYITAMIIVTSTMLLAESWFFYDELGELCQLGIALMFASISVLVSPGTVMAIKIELDSVGHLTSLMLGATMTAEFIVLISFSIARIICSTYCAKLDVSFLNLMFTMGIVGSNILVGVLLGGVIILIFKIPGGGAHHGGHGDHGKNASYLDQKTGNKGGHSNPDMESQSGSQVGNCALDELHHAPPSSFMSPRLSLGLKAFIWLSMGYMFYISTNVLAEATAAAFGLSWEIKFEALLVLMIGSCVAGHYEPIRHDMHVILDATAPYMLLPFFVMTGAALQLDQALKAVPLMAMYVMLRYISIFIACYLGGRYILKLSPMQYNNLWLTLTPQAGVALGLANEVKAMSDEAWAMEFAATIVAAVVVNQIIGPPLCSMGLRRSGETLKDRMLQAEALKGDSEHMDKSFHGGRSSIVHVNGDFHKSVAHGGGFRNSVVSGGGGFGNSMHSGEFARGSLFEMGRVTMSGTTGCAGDPHPLLPFTKVQNAVVIGDDEVAFEIALELSLYGARVNVPLLDQERTEKWQKMNEAILHRAAKGDLISYKNTLKDRENAQAMSAADVIIFTGDSNRTRENVQMLKSLLGAAHPRMIAFVPDCEFSKEMKAQGVLVIQPSIAMANIATRMALLDAKLAEALSNEISTTSDFSTASYFLRGHSGDLADLRLEGRRMALGRNVVNHHSVDYDRLAEALTSEHLPLPPPPPRVAVYGTSSAAGFDPFQRDTRSDFFVMHEDHDEADEIILDTQTGPYTTRGNSRLSVQRPPAQLGASRVRGGNVARGKRTPGSHKPRY